MPVRFRCVYCNQLLGISSRKAGTVVRCTETHRYDQSTRLLTMELAITSLDSDSPEVLSLTLRQIFPEEMTPLLEDAGFEVLFRTSRFSPYAPGAKGFDEESEDERGEMLAWVCRQR